MNLQPDPAVLSALVGWLPAARWFADKDRAVRGIAVRDAVAVGDGVMLLLVDVESDGLPARYVVPVDAAGHDASRSRAFVRWVVATAMAGGTLPGRAGRVVGRCVGPPVALAAELADVVPLGADASNTSCRAILGEASLSLKLLRRCRQGVQPEVEVGEFLARHTTWQGTPPLRGWLDYVSADGSPAATLVTLHEFASGCTNAWDHLLRLVAASGCHDARVLAIIDSLAAVTADMHAALASRPDLPAFAPEPVTAADRRRLADGLAAHVESVCALAETAAFQAPPSLRGRLLAVAAARPRLQARLQAVAELRDDSAAIRVHGDYHLGQVLLDDRDRPLVIDFEGEPGRSLEDRRGKASACKDVAGMCRSFDYLLRCAARDGGPAYRAEASAAVQERFVDGYASRVAGHIWWPARSADARELLAVYVLDKALYELAYEIQNRPAWIDVPLAAVEAY